MSTISEVTGSTNSGQLSAITGSSTLGKEDFLTLLVAQLQNQDPLNPSDPTEFTAQLAQYSSLEQLMSVNSNIENLASASQSQQQLSALGLIGREVIAEQGKFQLGDSTVTLGYELDAKADRVELHVQDSRGNSLAVVKPEDLSAGSHFVTWDGIGKNNLPVPPGDYTLSVLALDSNEEGISSQPLIKSRVTGVDLDGSHSTLVTNSGSYALSKIRSIREL
ncbi:MAG: flagellar hook assembly protein FlgD [Syntrophotaleaceae bacterium]